MVADPPDVTPALGQENDQLQQTGRVQQLAPSLTRLTCSVVAGTP